MRNRFVDVSDFWHAGSFVVARSLVLHLIADDPSYISLTFPAADDDQAVADAIGDTVETFLSASRHGRLDEDEMRRWGRRAVKTDYRVIHRTGWNVVDDTTIPVSMFGAGGGVNAPVNWLRFASWMRPMRDRLRCRFTPPRPRAQSISETKPQVVTAMTQLRG